MKIALVWPLGFDTNYVLPIALGYLKSNLDNEKHEVKIVDCALNNWSSESKEFKQIMNEFQPDVVGVSCWSINYREVVELANNLKAENQDVITICGGCHATAYPESLLNNDFDFVFRGEAELSFPFFLEEVQKEKPDWSRVKGLSYLQEGQLVDNPVDKPQELDVIKTPNYDDVNLETYFKKGYRLDSGNLRHAPIWTTRGCPYTCEFCSTYLLNGYSIRKHSMDYVIDWVKHLYYDKNIRQVNIIDDNFTFHIEYAKEFCNRIIELNLKGLTLFTPNEIRVQKTDEELLRLMKKAGWNSVSIAPESGSFRVLKLMSKGLNPDMIPQKVELIKKVGLKVQGTFIIGYPGETKEDLDMTIKFIRKCKFNFFFLNTFQPLPATKIYDKLVEEGKIKKGVLPQDFSSGKAVYVGEELKDVNFALLRLREYAYLALTNPLNIPYMIKFGGLGMIANKIISNITNVFKSKPVFNHVEEDADDKSKTFKTVEREKNIVLVD